MNTPLKTILPPSLRAHCENYYSSDQRANKFVVINTVGMKFEVRMGVWIRTCDPTQDIRGKALIVLRKDTGDLRFEQESINVLRQDEFEWMLRESGAYLRYKDMMKYATLGNTTAITIYLHLQALGKLFHMEPAFIFEYLDKFRSRYDPNELMKGIW